MMLNPDFRDILSAFNAERVEYLPDGDTAWVMDVISHDEIKLWGRRK